MPWSRHGGPWPVTAGVAMIPPVACRASPTACHRILSHSTGCCGDAMVDHGWYHGNTTEKEYWRGTLEELLTPDTEAPCQMSFLQRDQRCRSPQQYIYSKIYGKTRTSPWPTHALENSVVTFSSPTTLLILVISSSGEGGYPWRLGSAGIYP